MYSKKELQGQGKQRRFSGDDLQQIAFPLGGIGAGCLHLGGAGNLQDFCLFNAPAFGHSPMSFAAVHCQPKGRKTGGVLRVLEGPVQNPHIYNQGRFGNGGLASGHEGLPHMEAAEFCGEFPFARVKLKDRDLPLAVSLEAYSPFVPGDDIASGLPAAFLRYSLRNTSGKSLKVQFSFNAQYPAPADLHGHEGSALQGHRVVHRRQGGSGGLYFDNELPDNDLRKMSIAVVSSLKGHKADCAWFRGGWFDALTMLSNRLQNGSLKAAPKSKPPLTQGRSRFGATLFWNLELAAGETVDIPLTYCWHVPNTQLSYGRDNQTDCCDEPAYRPHYATLYDDAWQVACHALGNASDLYARTRSFHRSLFSSTLPDYVLDAISANLAILKSPTVLRQEDGLLWCWEGSSYANGCCAGSCDHVWNYAQALPYLFPQLERGLREQELKWSMDERGHVTFRSALPTAPVGHGFHAASDGQLGGIIKVYREWQISGDTAWLREHYPQARRGLEYCIRTWDPDEKGALIEPHHNTYDIEFWGPDIMCTGFYLGALQAAAAMADTLGKGADQTRYLDLAAKGKAFVDNNLWNGEYYVQKVQWKNLRAGKELKKWLEKPEHRNDPGYTPEAVAILKKEGPKYQYGSGCISDGVMGQWLTRQMGLPDALDAGRSRKHLKAIFRHNFRPTLRGHNNPQRPGYALNDEPGMLLCSWPRGGKPSLPFVYSDEVWTGIEYQVASHMLWEGMLEEGLSIVKAVRQRYDGKVRNPWNEYECGNYYARALASYGLLLALSGWRYEAARGRLDLAPQLPGAEGRFFFAVESGWGTVSYRKTGKDLRLRLQVAEGALSVAELNLGGSLSKKPRRVVFDRPRQAKAGRTLTLDL